MIKKTDFSDAGFPLSYAQHSIWHHLKRTPGTDPYILSVRLGSRQPLSLERLGRVLEELCGRHPQLSIRIDETGAVPHQLPGGPPRPVHVPYRWGSERERLTAMEREARTPFELSAGPLVRLSLWDGPDGSQDLVFSWHHLVGDAWSFALLFDEFSRLYTGSNRLSPVTASYRRFIERQEEALRGEAGERAERYWRSELEGLRPLHGLRPLGATAPQESDTAVENGPSHTEGTLAIPLPAGIDRTGAGYTLFEYVLGSYAVLLSRYTGSAEVPVLVPLLGRTAREELAAVGQFSTLAVVRIPVDGSSSFTRILETVHRKIREAQRFQYYPFMLMVERFAAPAAPGHFPFSDAYCGMVRLTRGLNAAAAASGGIHRWRSAPHAGQTGTDQPFELRGIAQRGAPWQLALDLYDGADGGWLEFRYPRPLWNPDEIETLAVLFSAVLGAAFERPDAMIENLPDVPRAPWLETVFRSDGDLEPGQAGSDQVRHAVSTPDRTGNTPPAAPSSPTERRVLEIWRSVLGREEIGIDDNFFALGGHSLRATQVMTRITDRFELSLPLETLFRLGTIRELAAHIDALQGAGAGQNGAPDRDAAAAASGANHQKASVPAASDRSDRYFPLSFSQERMWFIQRLEPESSAYNIHVTIRIRGPLDTERLSLAFRRIQERHEMLRAVFHERDGVPVQSVRPEPLASLELCDLSAEPFETRQVRARLLAEAEAAHRFDPERGPLVRMTVLRLTETDHVLCLNLHHLIGDQWSIGILSKETAELYRGTEPPGAPPAAFRYRDYVSWLRARFDEERETGLLRYWKRALRDLPALELPYDRPRPPVQTYRGGSVFTPVSPEERERITALSLELGLTPFMLLVSCYALLLSRYSGRTVIPVGSPVANRMTPAVEPLVGTFVNTLVLPIRVPEERQVRVYLAEVKAIVLEAFEHQDYPFERLVQALNPDRDTSRNPLVQVTFNLVNTPQTSPFAEELSWEPFHLERIAVQFDLTLGVDLELTPEFRLFYNQDLFRRETAERLLASFRTVLAFVLSNPEAPVREIPVLDPGETEALVHRRNGPVRRYPAERPLPELLSAQAERQADRTAIVYHSSGIRYRELFTAAGTFANLLRKRNIGEGAIVGLHLGRSPHLIEAMLGTLAAGAAYLPLDPSYPRTRLEYMLERSGASALVTERSLAGTLGYDAGPVLVREELEREREAVPAVPPPLDPDPDRLMYVLYTSGSTGDPKGVEIPNRAFVNLLFSMAETPGFGPEDGVLAVTPVSFDIAGLELFLPLLAGGTIHLADSETARDPFLLKEALADPRITVMQATPATWRMLVSAGWRGPLRRVLCGGEAFPPDLREPLLSAAAEVWNMYGPTETTIWSTVHRVKAATDPASAGGSIPIGTPIANTTVRVLDEAGRPVPVGVPGELFIGGAGVACGYRGREDLTNERFVPDPFLPGERLYRTGDIVRFLPDGSLEYRERRDTQVKLNGHRIELSEIEHAISLHPSVAQAVSRIVTIGTADSRLAAYCIPAPGRTIPDTATLRAFLGERLPPYMIPSAFVAMEAFPLTANGKIDRMRLPAPQIAFETLPETDLPADGLERRVYEVWKTVLQLQRFGMEENFFSLGGHSLLAVRLTSALNREFGVSLPLRSFFLNPTVRGTARWIGRLLENGRVETGTGTPDRFDETDVVFPMHAEGTRPPVFIVAGLHVQENGLYRFLSSLVRHLGTDRPVFGLRPRGLVRPAPRYEDVGEMAAEYIDQMLTVRPHGPYLLVGECVGGIVAYEMARRLRVERGEEVRLILLDTRYPDRIRRTLDLVRRTLGKPIRWVVRLYEAVKPDPRSALPRVRALIRTTWRSVFPATEDEQRRNRFKEVEGRYGELVDRYAVPALPGTAHLVVNETDYLRHGPLGWSGAESLRKRPGPDRLEVIVTPGDHVTRLTDHGRKLGEAIRRILENGERYTNRRPEPAGYGVPGAD